jgi:hypothetical protein
LKCGTCVFPCSVFFNLASLSLSLCLYLSHILFYRLTYSLAKEASLVEVTPENGQFSFSFVDSCVSVFVCLQAWCSVRLHVYYICVRIRVVCVFSNTHFWFMYEPSKGGQSLFYLFRESVNFTCIHFRASLFFSSFFCSLSFFILIFFSLNFFLL